MQKSFFIISIIFFISCYATNHNAQKTTEQEIKPLDRGYIRRPILGVVLKFTNGYVEINSVEKSGGGGIAGLKSGDIIVAMDSKPIRKRIDLIKYLETKQIAESVVVTIIRDKIRRNYIVNLGYGDFHQIFDALLRINFEEKKINLIITVGNINSMLSMWPSEFEQWKNAIHSQLLTYYENKLINAFKGESNFAIVNRYQVETIFNELKLSQAGFLSGDLRNKLIELLQATHLLIIEFSRFGSNNGFEDVENLRLVEIETGKVIASASYSTK